jgi:hypothetical protein
MDPAAEPTYCAPDGRRQRIRSATMSGFLSAVVPGRTRRSAGAVAAGAIVVASALVAAAPGATASTAAPARWLVVKTLGSNNTDMFDLTALPGGSVWAGGAAAADTPELFHDSGGKVRPTSLPGALGEWVIDLAGTAVSNVWAALSDAPRVEYLTKHGWKAKSFAIGKNQVQIDGVVTAGQKDTVVLADDIATQRGYAFHFNGVTWSRQSMPVETDGDSDYGLVSGSAGNNVWALAFARGGAPEAVRYDGRKWHLTAFPAKLVPRRDTVESKEILAVSPTDDWATLQLEGPASLVGPPLLLHWNGSHWSRVAGKLPNAVLAGPLASDGHGGVWLSASNAALTVPELLDYNGGRWTTYTVPEDRGKLLDITALSLVPGTSTVLGTAIVNYGPGGSDGSVLIEYKP